MLLSQEDMPAERCMGATGVDQPTWRVGLRLAAAAGIEPRQLVGRRTRRHKFAWRANHEKWSRGFAIPQGLLHGKLVRQKNEVNSGLHWAVTSRRGRGEVGFDFEASASGHCADDVHQ